MRSPLLPLVILGLLLRMWSAGVATVHDDELHYAEDAGWARAPLSVAETVHFLRHHPGEHMRLDPLTGARRPWGRGRLEIARLGHPCLVQLVHGVAAWVVEPATPAAAVMTGRVVNGVLDAGTIALLPQLVAVLGGAEGAGLLAAALYAVFPPAVTYGALDYLDPPLAPLLVLLLVLVLAPGGGTRRWLVIGAVTGLMITCKQVGMIALVIVPVLALVAGRASLGGLVTWALAAAATVVLIVDPGSYIEVLRHPSRPVGALHLTPLEHLAGNLGTVAQASTYYWLSFERHAEPLAPLMARVHPVLTPGYLIAYAAALLAAAASGMARRLAALALPVLLMLAMIMPSDAMWRFHLLSPLVCAGAALVLVEASWWYRPVVVGAAVVAGALAVLPPGLGRGGAVDLGDLLFMNPQARQTPRFHGPEHPLEAYLRPGVNLSRLVRLSPGRYEVSVTGRGTATVTIDGRSVMVAAPTPAPLTVAGFVHRLTVSFPTGGLLRGLAIAPEPPAALAMRRP